MSPERSIPLYQKVKNDFAESGVSCKFKRALSDQQIQGCAAGTINDDQENSIYNIELFRENKTDDYFIRGNIPASLNKILLEKGINDRCNDDNLNPPENEIIHYLECTISSVDQLKILVEETKKFYNLSL